MYHFTVWYTSEITKVNNLIDLYFKDIKWSDSDEFSSKDP